MKKLIFTMFAMFAYSSTYADTETINWYIDGNIYNTTQCESGGDVSLPPTPPERLGYTFTGWQEVFNRGTFNSWADIPNVATGYLSDSYGSYTPKENDYIIVSDASGVPSYEGIIKIEAQTANAYTWRYCRTYIENVDYGCNGDLSNGKMFVYNDSSGPNGRRRYYWRSDTTDIICNGTIYTHGNVFLNIVTDNRQDGTYYAKFINGYPYTGTWRLRYVGNWDDYKRGGWIPEKRLD